MIQAANVGVGIRGKEGQQASLAADYSVEKFSALRRLLLWHGRNCFQRSVRLAILIIHRGLMFSWLQVLFSALFYFVSVPLFQGALAAGWPVVYTSFLLFSVVLDAELPEHTVLLYPELYAGLRAEERLSFKTFLIWLSKAVYQASAIILLSMFFFEDHFINIVAITFTCCFAIECLSVAAEVSLWHPLIIWGQVLSVLTFLYTVISFQEFFDLTFVADGRFFFKIGIIVLAAWLPVWVGRRVARWVEPSQHRKLVEGGTEL